jgi:hypothetical protein
MVPTQTCCPGRALYGARHAFSAQINTIAAELRALQVSRRQPFRDENAAIDHRLDTFNSMWLIEGAGTRFPYILAFCGALASGCSNTATVESDFSIIVCGKCLIDLSLEGFVHCKQWQWLSIKTANDGSV